MSKREMQLEAELRQVRELESNLTFRIATVNKVLEQQTTKLISDTSLGLTGYRVMRVVSIFKEITVSELSRQMVVDRALISRVSAALVEQGYVEYHEDAANKRKKLISLTPEGQTLMAKLAPRFERRRAQLENAIGETAMQGLWHALDAISSLEFDDP
ncbi:MarR family winged helix-turn-helix transcriptional regulator [Ruegeria lacuscaerulensis]|uniref:MarR family winged helix-turn-helix transcriptional regulator n=1 Tax=Ruegeria lacuscaerulensis TaxID=55218 RepID=UPI00147EF0C5|nr:MarR family transcriptional regulator [Ruegeria lacuscaerulensis]